MIIKSSKSRLSSKSSKREQTPRSTSSTFSTSSTSGFTLIELLVVLSIIAVLAAFIMSNFIGIRQRARDAQRKSDVRQLQAALELYRADVGSYPADTSFPDCGSALTSGGSTYIQKIPCDPLSGGDYTYSSGTATYSIITCLENQNDTEIDKDDDGDKINCSPSTTLWQRTFNNP